MQAFYDTKLHTLCDLTKIIDNMYVNEKRKYLFSIT